MREKALTVTMHFDSLPKEWTANDASSELQSLCESAGLSVSQNFIFRQRAPTAPFLIGKGKVERLSLVAQQEKAGVVVFESDLSPSQQRNLEEIIPGKTLDRTQLILDIFAQRARSNEGKLQVELAQLKYLLPRLSGKGINLSRLGGGVGTRGPGEQKLEMDRRRIRDRIVKLTRELGGMQSRRQSDIERKKEKEIPLVALVGYTNAGKSSLFNALTQSSLQVKNQLFSTLDTTTRAVQYAKNKKILLADTVGFIKGLPHHLVESFKATLEETVHADLLLHVMDASRPDLLILKRAVEGVLDELKVEPKKVLYVLNKADLLSQADRKKVCQDWPEAACVSSVTGEGIKELREKLMDNFEEQKKEMEIFIPKDQLSLAHHLYENGTVLRRRDSAQGARFTVRLSPKALGIINSLLKRVVAHG